jgi:hypothetical protein
MMIDMKTTNVTPKIRSKSARFRQHPAEGKPEVEELLLAAPLPGPQRH